jgi:hypothetical protein
MNSKLGPEDMLEVTFNDSENFLKIKETLTRIGISSKEQNKLYQSCHILHKKGKYYIVHFKEMFLLDGLDSDISENDIGRRNRIAKLLEEWGLLDIVDKQKSENPLVSLAQIKIVSFRDKKDWELICKYHVGTNKKG